MCPYLQENPTPDTIQQNSPMLLAVTFSKKNVTSAPRISEIIPQIYDTRKEIKNNKQTTNRRKQTKTNKRTTLEGKVKFLARD